MSGETTKIGLFVLAGVILGGLLVGMSKSADSIPPNFKKEIGYMACWNQDGTGPVFECGKMKVRCYTERGGKEIICPFFDNLK